MILIKDLNFKIKGFVLAFGYISILEGLFAAMHITGKHSEILLIPIIAFIGPIALWHIHKTGKWTDKPLRRWIKEDFF